MVVVDEVLHADQEHVYSSRSFHREVLGIVPGKMETATKDQSILDQPGR